MLDKKNTAPKRKTPLFFLFLPTVFIILLTIGLVWYNAATAPKHLPAVVTERVQLNPYPELEGVLIDLNTADTDSLQILPGIGPEKARRIVEYVAANAPLTEVEQLLEVEGIGNATLDTIRPFITVAPATEASQTEKEHVK